MPNQECSFRLQVARPHLPRTEALVPYLRAIDEARWYTNGGPLVRRLEACLAAAVGSRVDSAVRVTMVSCGTTGLTIALRAAVGERTGCCLVPSWSFAATSCAVIAAGLSPHFVDVEPETWLADRRQVAALVRSNPERFVALLLVQRAGQIVDLDPWRDLARAHKLALVVDAADCFDCLRPGAEPQVVSLHACKALGVGEGGFVVSTDPALIARTSRLANFGFGSERVSDTVGINAKMSEYAAAVGLAALITWPKTRLCWLERAAAYRKSLGSCGVKLLAPADAVCATALVDLGQPLAAAVEAKLRAHHIEARRWWGEGCHRQLAFSRWPVAPTPVTDALAKRILGLPFHVDLDDDSLNLVVDLMAEALSDAEACPPSLTSIANVRR